MVFDPFCGGGTAPLEACVTGRVGVGSDALEYARVLTSSKIDPPDIRELSRYLGVLAGRAAAVGDVPLDNEDVEVFYNADTLKVLLKYRAVLLDEPMGRCPDFTRALICALLHGPSKMFLSWPMKETCSSTVGYITRYRDEHAIVPTYKSVRCSVFNKAKKVLGGSPLPVIGTAHLSDSRALPLTNESVDLVLTSPPYMRVLDYTWNNWLRLWFLGVDRKDARDALVLTSSESRWTAFMRCSLSEMYRVLKRDRACVIVVGDVKKGTVFNSAAALAEIASDIGFSHVLTIDDDYATRNRALLVYNDLKYNSFDRMTDRDKLAMPMDRCLVLSKGALDDRNPMLVM